MVFDGTATSSSTILHDHVSVMMDFSGTGTTGVMVVGNTATGTLQVLNGATIYSAGGIIAANAGSQGTATVNTPLGTAPAGWWWRRWKRRATHRSEQRPRQRHR